MPARTEPAAAAPVFADWVDARAHALQRFAYLTTGDVRIAGAVLEQVLASVLLQWRELADVGDPELVLRQEILRVQASRRHRRAKPANLDSSRPPSQDEQDDQNELVQVWRVCHSMDLEDRAALVLRYAEQMDLLDIADVLGRDQRAVRGLLASGVSVVAARAQPRRRGTPDAESLLRATFADYAGRAPVVEDLGARVVALTRRRRRRQVTVGVAMALALLLPVAWLVAPDDAARDGGGPAEPDPGVPVAAVPGMRWESYGGVEVQVPETWGYGDLTQWCADDGAPGHVDGPAVDRGPAPGWTPVCSANDETGTRGVPRPTYTAGLLLRPAGAGPRIGRADVANGAPVYRRRVGQVDLTVIDVERSLARSILASATRVAGTDINGCAPHTDVPAMGRFRVAPGDGLEAFARTAADAEVVSMSACHYETEPWERPTLVFSERSGRAGVHRMLTAIGSAGSTGARLPRDPRRQCVETEAALLRFSAAGGGPTDVWVHYAGCGAHGVDDGVRTRRLSAEVLEPILDPPWRGQVGPGVPWPAGGRDGNSGRAASRAGSTGWVD